SAKNSEAVLSVLDRKVDDIDSEVALLHELKEIVLEFIRQMRQVDFHNDADVKMLFAKANEIETSLTKENTNIEQLLDTSDVVDERLTSVAVECIENNVDVKLDKFEIIENFGPYRFIGKSIYTRAWQESSIAIERASWHLCDWVFETLDNMTEYISDQKYYHSLFTWDRYDDKNQLMCYTIGKFMKPDTPVPMGMEYHDIEATTIAQGWASGDIEGVKRLDQVHNVFYAKSGKPTFDALALADYNEQSWKWTAQVFPVGYLSNPQPWDDGRYYVGNFVPCAPKEMELIL
ncbi:MAG: hypothetical protein FWE06_09710, partial [Oscillospiraceae bacterium]|nr:hypothetical protein [Oscillospiraceae bacterium]